MCLYIGVVISSADWELLYMKAYQYHMTLKNGVFNCPVGDLRFVRSCHICFI